MKYQIKEQKCLADQIFEEVFQKVPTQFESSKSSGQKICPICLFQIQFNFCTPLCGHAYHQKCFQSMIQYKRECSLCRLIINGFINDKHKYVKINEEEDSSSQSSLLEMDEDTPFYISANQTYGNRTSGLMMNLAMRIQARDILNRQRRRMRNRR